MTVKMIVAVDQGNAIGWKDGRLPWKIPYDMRLFKEKTTGGTVMMGRTTFESLNMPNGLPNRRNIVLTSDKDKCDSSFTPGPGLSFFNDFKTFAMVHQQGLGVSPDDLWVIGGASVYTQALQAQMIDELHVTRVHESSGADVTLPFDLYQWEHFPGEQRTMGVNWELIDMIRPTVIVPSPGIDIAIYRKAK